MTERPSGREGLYGRYIPDDEEGTANLQSHGAWDDTRGGDPCVICGIPRSNAAKRRCSGGARLPPRQ